MLQFLLYFVLNKCSLSKTKVQNINNKCGVWKIALLMMYSHMKYSSVGAAVIVPVDFYLVQCIALSAGFFCLFFSQLPGLDFRISLHLQSDSW